MNASDITESVFWSKVRVTPMLDGCWEWTGSLNSKGYGRIKRNGKTASAHRLSYLINMGSPDGLFVCHRCDNRKCVRPDHLFLGTIQDNTADMDAKGRRFRGNIDNKHRKKTHCPSGHEYTKENTYTNPGSVRRKRICRECQRVHHKNINLKRNELRRTNPEWRAKDNAAQLIRHRKARLAMREDGEG